MELPAFIPCMHAYDLSAAMTRDMLWRSIKSHKIYEIPCDIFVFVNHVLESGQYLLPKFWLNTVREDKSYLVSYNGRDRNTVAVRVGIVKGIPTHSQSLFPNDEHRCGR